MRLGNVTRIQEETRTMGIIEWLDSALQDARYGLRTIAANKTFSMLAILSLALGIGANTAIYSFMDSLLLRSLPVSDPESLAVLNWGANPTGRDFVMRSMSGSTWSDHKWAEIAGIFPFPAFELIRTNSGAVFSSVFAYYPTRKVNVMVKGQAEQAEKTYQRELDALLAEGLASAEHGLIVFRISRKCFLRHILCAFPILALGVTRRHIRVNLLDELICLSDTRRGDEQHTAFKNSRAIWSVMNRTSDRSFGAAAASIDPDFIAEATAPPDLQK